MFHVFRAFIILPGYVVHLRWPLKFVISSKIWNVEPSRNIFHDFWNCVVVQKRGTENETMQITLSRKQVIRLYQNYSYTFFLFFLLVVIISSYLFRLVSFHLDKPVKLTCRLRCCYVEAKKRIQKIKRSDNLKYRYIHRCETCYNLLQINVI